jgi:hypothetical protein
MIASCYSNAQSTVSSQLLIYDTSKIAIIPYHQDIPWMSYDYDVDSSADLTQQDISEVKKIFEQSVTDHNNKIPDSVKKNSHYTIDLKNRDYKTQYVCTINRKNEKIVYVCCFCNLIGLNWRTFVFIAEEGNCFFTVKIDLTAKKYFDFSLDNLQ